VDYPKWFDVRPLVYHRMLNHFTPNASMESIVKEMMIEKWNPSIFYKQYYELCAPSYCTYSSTVRAKTTVGIIVSLISTIGGLCSSLKFITPYFVQFVGRLFRLTNRRQRQQQQGNFSFLKLIMHSY